MVLPGYLCGPWRPHAKKHSTVRDKFFSDTIGCEWSWGFRVVGGWDSVASRKRSVVKPCVG